MKVFLSTDIEGTAGIADWDQVIPGERAYEEGRRLLLAEVNAAIDGAVDAGAGEILVNDAHHTMHNLPPDELTPRPGGRVAATAASRDAAASSTTDTRRRR